uniref:NADH dehydrogenase subunit 1 n=1 Tax=Lima vulgaris TaxID=2671060 RepID=UPI0028FC7B89|nr:NADH dehydrogenase subunit 1 [Lima vulgaris]WNB40321.1 NADH dehydrogenase subunit 1 [Lima vulgaris]
MPYWFVCIVSSFVAALLGVGFLTLLERKLLAYAQSRQGPCMVGVLGLGQPFADAIKLFTKEMVVPHRANRWAFLFAPVLMLSCALMLWLSSPSLMEGGLIMGWGVLFVVCVSSAAVHGVLMAGWASNSKYALLGAVRAMAQVVSYEVVMLFLVVIPVVLWGANGCLFYLASKSWGVYLGVSGWFFLAIWIFCITAETNRAPFDFAEGESELVSGFNVEYSGGPFAMVFMAEYSNVVFMGIFTSLLFVGYGGESGLIACFIVCCQGALFACLMVWMRAGFPRYRYDLLMATTWKSLLPVSLSGFGVLLVLISVVL